MTQLADESDSTSWHEHVGDAGRQLAIGQVVAELFALELNIGSAGHVADRFPGVAASLYRP